MFNNLLTKILIIILIIISAIGIYLYIQNQNLRKDNVNKENSIKVLNQNDQAYKDNLNQKTDSLLNYSIFVSNLKNENLVISSKYNILKTTFVLLQDSLIKLYGNANSIISDSSIKVAFNGEKNSIKYDGYTEYYPYNKKSIYDISLYQAPMSIFSLVYLDSSDIIKNEIYANGNLISNAKTEIDSSVYLKIMSKNINNINKLTFFDRLQLFGNIEYNNNNKLMNLNYGILYQFSNGFSPYLEKQINNSGLIFGIGYIKSIRDFVKIF